MNKKKRSIRISWQNDKYPPIPQELVWLDSVPSENLKEKLTYISTYLYHGIRFETKECHHLHETLDLGTFEIYVGMN